MGKIFRLHNSATNTIQGWGDSQLYNKKNIEEIQDPNGASKDKRITSIPSPFARMALVKSAFHYVSKKDEKGRYPNYDEDNIYNKLVSDSLDVGQIFFEYSKWKDYVEILAWDKVQDLQKLADSEEIGHQQLAATYELFLEQDAEANNFDKLQRIYILNFKKGGPNPINVIGATSPSTLFFSTPNDLSYVTKVISFGQGDKPFDNAFTPLYKRDIRYHQYLYALHNQEGFAKLFPEVYTYIEASYTKSDQERRAQLDNADWSVYEELNIGSAGDVVEVVGINLKQSQGPVPPDPENCDFVIHSEIAEDKPLVLPVSLLTDRTYKYVNGPWNKNTKAPYFDARPLEERTLPDDGQVYPYLTMNDFLEDMILQDEEKPNENESFFGNKKGQNKTYLLPLKPLFFKYFTTDQLINGISVNGKTVKMFEIAIETSSVQVTLRIPVKKGSFCIEYKKNYIIDVQPSEDGKNGGIVDLGTGFSVGLMPNVAFSDDASAYYRIAVIPNENEVSEINVRCYYKTSEVPVDSTILRNTQHKHLYEQCYVNLIEQKRIDRFSISKGNYTGVVVPIMRSVAGTEQFSFAIDFGTTNTHIEYKNSDSRDSKAFDITNDDIQIEYLTEISDVQKFIFDFDLVPELVGVDGALPTFPLRTALSYAADTNWGTPVLPMAHANFPFAYEKRIEYKYNKIQTDLKWIRQNDPDNKRKVEAYMENLFWLLRNKVILNNGNLKSTKIVWFYPTAMSRGHVGQFETAWRDAYSKYFGGDINNVTKMTESEAPYKYFAQARGNVDNIVTVDIGGGTTDVVFAAGGQIQCLTSFRFAANNLFSDPYAKSVIVGIVDLYKNTIGSTIHDNLEDKPTEKVFNDVIDAGNSSDIASFFFSLSSNSEIVEKKLTKLVDFNKMLQDDGRFKIIFVLFYASLVYHVASLMKAKTLPMPRHIAFSGNGSKVISVLSPDSNIIKDFTKMIFEKVYDKDYDNNGLDLIFEANPKVVTCKGGLRSDQKDKTQNVEKLVLKSFDNMTFVSEADTYSTIDDKYLSSVEKQVDQFYKFFFSLNKQFSFEDNFCIDKQYITKAEQICEKDISTYLVKGLTTKKQEVNDDDSTISETLFFYPIAGHLSILSNELNNMSK